MCEKNKKNNFREMDIVWLKHDWSLVVGVLAFYFINRKIN